MKKILLLSLFTFTTLAGHADEGMWMLTDLKEQNAATMYDMGLDISIDKVYCPDSISLKDAVVHFGGGCTGEIISAEGLVLTNHHCGYSYIQQHSSVEHDYLTDGFWAMSRKEELPCKGLTVTFIDRILDVTPYVRRMIFCKSCFFVFMRQEVVISMENSSLHGRLRWRIIFAKMSTAIVI